MRLFLVNLGYVLLALNFILYALGFFKNGKSYKIFTAYLFLLVSVELISNVLRILYNNNLFMSHFYFVGQFVLLSLFYLNLVKGQFQKKVIKIGFALVLLTLVVQYGLKPELFIKFNLYEIFITSFLLIIFATFHFYNMLDQKKESYFINMGILLYLFGSTILFLVGNLTIKFSSKFTFITWILNAFLIVLFHLFILYEWKINYRKSKEIKAID